MTAIPDHSSSSTSGAEAFPGVHARSRRFTVGSPRNVTVLDRNRILFLRSRSGDDPVLCLWQLDLDSPDGAEAVETVLVDPAELAADDDLPAAERARRERARESAGGIVAYTVDRSGDRLCFGLAGSLFVVDLDGGPGAPDGSGLRVRAPEVRGPVFDPRLSPDGRRIAYVSGDDLRVVDLDGLDGDPGDGDPADGVDRVASSAGDRALAEADDPTGSSPRAWGRAEFVAAEEMQRSRGFWWSPDGERLLVTRVDESRVARWWIADPAHPERPPTGIRYPAAGTANAEVELWLFDLDGGRRRIDWDDGGDWEYLANVVWSGEHPPLVVRERRDQRAVSVAELDLDTLGLTERRVITDDVWVELMPGSPTPSEHGLLTIEDLTPDDGGPGHRALLLDGRPVTDGSLHVRSLIGVVGHRAVVTAWTVPTEVHVVTVDLGGDLTGGQAPVVLTTEPGVHAAVLGRGRAGADPSTTDEPAEPPEPPVVVLTTSRPDTQGLDVTVRDLLDADTASQPRLGGSRGSIGDRSLRSPIPALPTFLELGADRLSSALFLPSTYDGSHPLPVLLDPYGGPHAQRVMKHHTPHLVSQWFAEQGFAVLVVDGRGTPGRGPTWERAVWGDLAGPVLDDQLAALDAAADEFDGLDLDRVGIRGWSFGGYLAALAVLRRPDRVHAAVAGAPVTDWRLYDTHYTERYLGRPDLHPLHYRRTDLTAEADRLTRPLLLIHGLADDNVVAAHTLRLSTALLAAGAPHRVLPLSGVTHMTPQEVVAENLLWLQLHFLREALGLGPDGGGPPPPVSRPPARGTDEP